MANRYDTPQSSETQFQPGSNGEVLRNLPGINSKQKMDQREYEALVEMERRYAKEIITENSRITAQMLREMHFDWLGKLYEWAGKYRTVNVAKGDFKWPPIGFVERSMMNFESGLLARYTPCRPASVPQVAGQIAEIHAEFLLIHPFRDGNGRIARWVADIMAMQAGLPVPEYNFSGSGAFERKQNYIEAVQRGYALDFEPLTVFFAFVLEEAKGRSVGSGNVSRVNPSAPSSTEE